KQQAHAACDELVRFAGTFAPVFRASESPIAMACLRLFTFPPLPPFPERRVPLFLRRMALSTLLPAAFPYSRDLPELFFLPGMFPPAIERTNIVHKGVRTGEDETGNLIRRASAQRFHSA